jgi:hypothetical protein
MANRLTAQEAMEIQKRDHALFGSILVIISLVWFCYSKVVFNPFFAKSGFELAFNVKLLSPAICVLAHIAIISAIALRSPGQFNWITVSVVTALLSCLYLRFFEIYKIGSGIQSYGPWGCFFVLPIAYICFLSLYRPNSPVTKALNGDTNVLSYTEDELQRAVSCEDEDEEEFPKRS